MFKQPHEHARRVLLLVSGMSPQIVTETLYALTQTLRPAFVPTEVHLISTQTGADQACRNLLEGKCHFYRLCEDYGLDSTIFSADRIHVIRDASGQPLDDIRTPLENEAMADFITEKVCQLTRDDGAALHVSMAGGRKTMGYYAGYALSLFGRPQDRLSHVLVSEGYESRRNFFYPTPTAQAIHDDDGKPLLDRNGKPLDASKAEVSLAEIPFVRLGAGRPDPLLRGNLKFSETIAQSQKAQEPPDLVIDKSQRLLICGGEVVSLPPVRFAFYAWLAERGEPLSGPELLEAVLHQQYAEEFLCYYTSLMGEGRYKDNVRDALEKGMSKDYVDSAVGDIKRRLKQVLGAPLAEHYLIKNIGREKKGDARYALTLDADQIQWR
ncbi:CRISPR-associated ring nuclease Csm6 [Alloalcanivorax xenomutans]|uniref:CRISPR-associated ring nuclease Csm6 n=1 Tax=Alloalcanivorax xenomutans TaxID=1094342 RepID=UPI003A7FFDBE